jgi:hypothetical protein
MPPTKTAAETRKPSAEPNPDAWKPVPVPPSGPACVYCGKPTERNTNVFRAYNLTAIRCKPCKTASIEGDNRHYDIATAASGLLLRRAKDVYELKHPTLDAPPLPGVDRIYDVIMSDDERWSEYL